MARRMRAWLIWLAVCVVLIVPIVAAGASPLLAWRQPIYIMAGFAGVIALAVMLLQPLLAAALLPGLEPITARRVHRWGGATLIAALVLHVAGLWITSPPDVVDALLFRSPTPFSAWGVVAMWAVFGAATLAVIRRRLRLRVWRIGHTGLVTISVFGAIVHALLIEGTMEPVSKAVLCAAVALVTIAAMVARKPWAKGPPLRR